MDLEQGALAGVRVVEIADQKGVYCGKLLADMGARVTKIEAPGGDPTRTLPPLIPNPTSTKKQTELVSSFFLYMNSNKRSVSIDLESAAGQQALLALTADCDVVITTARAAELQRQGLNEAALRARNPRLIVTSITDFGMSGPATDWEGSDLVINALSGAMHCTGFPEDPPVKLAGTPAYAMASVNAAAATLIALRHASRCGQGQLVDVSALEAMTAVTSICGIGRWKEDGVVAHRYGTGLFAAVPSGAYACRDGLAYLIVNRPAHWKALALWINEITGNTEVLDTMFDGPSSSRLPYRELLDIFIGELATSYDVEDFYREGQRRHLAITPVSSAERLCSDPHLRERGFFCRPDDAPSDSIRYPGAHAKLASTPWKLRTTAPRCGEHNDDIQLATSTKTKTQAPRSTANLVSDPPAKGALDGLRVVEFTAGMAGPWIGRFMAACGADVIRVESISHPDVTRLFVPPRQPESGIQPQLSPWFTDWNAGKRFVSLDLTKSDGIAAAKQLISKCDVLIENYSTGALSRLGLDPTELRRDNPRLITFSTTGFGSQGPNSSYVTWGPNIEAASGLATLSGFPERDCTITQFAYPDPLSALHGLFSILCALHHRDDQDDAHDESGGQGIESAQIEATAATIGPLLMQVLAGDPEPTRCGNSSADSAPCGVYLCADLTEKNTTALAGDRWCAISVGNEGMWQRLCSVLDRSDLATDHRLNSISGRLRHVELVDEALSQWTKKRDAHEVMRILQSAGISAGVVQNVEDQALRDVQLEARNFFETIPHEVKGKVIATGIPLGLTATPAQTPSTGRAIGADNREVFVELCGMTQKRYEQLCQAGVVTSQNQFPRN
jgi:crotonobetainyl-CoA:carnitine CoA-transferase CaiB-like acyl-CoA transferase